MENDEADFTSARLAQIETALMTMLRPLPAQRIEVRAALDRLEAVLMANGITSFPQDSILVRLREHQDDMQVDAGQKLQ